MLTALRTRGFARDAFVVALVLVLIVLGTASPSEAARAKAFVRVNQVGYPATSAKRAYLMSSSAETGATFALKTGGGDTLFSGPIGRELGSWSNAYPFVYALDFDGMTTPGTYAIEVSGPVPATSPRFGIDSAQALYGEALANALSFYQAERDGPDFIPGPLRTAPAHLHDSRAMTYARPRVNADGAFSGSLTPLGNRIDASGGWWDAGDYIKGVQTLSYTTDMLLYGVRDFPRSMGPASVASDFTDEAKFGTDFLLRMWDDATATLYFQVGIGTGNDRFAGDHDLWRLPQEDDAFGGSAPRYRYIRHRPVFRAGPPGSLISPNLAGRMAAAFGLCFQIFHESDPAFAKDCLLSGQHVFDLADTTPSGRLLTYLPYGFYPETEWRSDLELGAVELFFATATGGLPAGAPHEDAAFYLRRAARWADAYITGPDDAADTLNLYDVSGLAHYELYRAIEQAGDPSNLRVTRAGLVADLERALAGAIAIARADAFRFGFPWASWDTASHGIGLSVMASEVAQLTGSVEYANWSGRWLANVMGANAWGSSFIVGDGTTFPHCIHHQVANIAGTIDGSAPILVGAVVEGPNGDLFHGFQDGMRDCPPDDRDTFARFNAGESRFLDDIESFSTVEPAVDLSATSPLAFAWQGIPVPAPSP